MVTIRDEGILLERTNLLFESEAVLNPGCIEVDGIVHMFYRAVRPGNFSTIGYCQLKKNKVIHRLDHPVLAPGYAYEQHSLEDPRIVFLGGIYYLFYTAYDGCNALGAYATSTDLVHFTKHGIISPQFTYHEAMDLIRHKPLHKRYFHYERQAKRKYGIEGLLWEKDMFMFPKKFNHKFLLVHRVQPSIQVVAVRDFSELTPGYWRRYFKAFEEHILLDPRYEHENHKIGGGCPPVETAAGWILIYHSVGGATSASQQYHASVALLDRRNPRRVIARLPHPLFSPSSSWERIGSVKNVVFPTSALINGDRLDIYYGAADSRIALKSVNLQELVSELKRHPET